MFPMVATVEEFRAARDLLEAEAARIRPAPERLEAGTMLEVPALMCQLPGLLAEADFVSVGTNDLMQFLFAADRGTPELADRYDTLSAPVLEMLERLVVACNEAGVPLSVCGEAAGRPLDALAFAGARRDHAVDVRQCHSAREGAAGGGGFEGVAPGFAGAAPGWGGGRQHPRAAGGLGAGAWVAGLKRATQSALGCEVAQSAGPVYKPEQDAKRHFRDRHGV